MSHPHYFDTSAFINIIHSCKYMSFSCAKSTFLFYLLIVQQMSYSISFKSNVFFYTFGFRGKVKFYWYSQQLELCFLQVFQYFIGTWYCKSFSLIFNKIRLIFRTIMLIIISRSKACQNLTKMFPLVVRTTLNVTR